MNDRRAEVRAEPGRSRTRGCTVVRTGPRDVRELQFRLRAAVRTVAEGQAGAEQTRLAGRDRQAEAGAAGPGARAEALRARGVQHGEQTGRESGAVVADSDDR